jgi:hypothetical protein
MLHRARTEEGVLRLWRFFINSLGTFHQFDDVTAASLC